MDFWIWVLVVVLVSALLAWGLVHWLANATTAKGLARAIAFFAFLSIGFNVYNHWTRTRLSTWIATGLKREQYDDGLLNWAHHIQSCHTFHSEDASAPTTCPRSTHIPPPPPPPKE